jgi:hypothetical protein
LATLQGFGTATVQRSKDCAGYQWKVKWNNGGKKDLMQIVGEFESLIFYFIVTSKRNIVTLMQVLRLRIIVEKKISSFTSLVKRAAELGN